MVGLQVSLFAQNYPGPWTRWESVGGDFNGIEYRTRIDEYNRFSEAWVYQIEIRNRYNRPVRVTFNMTMRCDETPDSGDWAGTRIAPGGTETLGGSFYWFLDYALLTVQTAAET
ncbi:MAG: hypothetical protein ACOC28_03505 [Alkalispirochaetaceae bacterium]